MLSFTLAAAALALTPGVDTALVLRSATAGGPRAGALAAAGVGLGCLAWGASVALGFGALVAASATAFTIVKYAGAGYLAWSGVRLLWRPGLRAASDPEAPERREGGALRRGLLTNLLNPKVGVFYVTFLPQFVPPGVNAATYAFLLACIHVLIGLVWFGILIAATLPLSRFLARPEVVRTMDRLTGVIFVAMAVRLTLARR